MNGFVRAGKVLLQQRSHRLTTLPVVILNLNDICNSRCVTCAIWENNERLREPGLREMSDDLLEDVYRSVARWEPVEVLLSGGEPTMHPRFGDVLARLRDLGPAVLVATNGLTLHRVGPERVSSLSSVFVSYDAPDASSYLSIRGVDGFQRMVGNIAWIRTLDPRPRVIGRCTLQRENVGRLPELVDSARRAGCDAISFLAVDTQSKAFGRERGSHAVDNERIAPRDEDLQRMEAGIATLAENEDGTFIESGVERLRSLHRYFLARAGRGEMPRVQCNAPWVSAVVETSGELRPCFFHPAIGRLGDLNGERGIAFRRSLDVGTHPTCQACVCSKRIGAGALVRS